MQCGRFLVNMVEERDKVNIIAPPMTFTQHATVEVNLKISSSDEVSSKETHAVLTPVPSTSKQILLPRTTIFHRSGAMKVILMTPMKILIFNI